MRMSDGERLAVLAELLESASVIMRDLLDEVAQHREVKACEEEILRSIGEAMGNG